MSGSIINWLLYHQVRTHVCGRKILTCLHPNRKPPIWLGNVSVWLGWSSWLHEQANQRCQPELRLSVLMPVTTRSQAAMIVFEDVELLDMWIRFKLADMNQMLYKTIMNSTIIEARLPPPSFLAVHLIGSEFGMATVDNQDVTWKTTKLLTGGDWHMSTGSKWDWLFESPAWLGFNVFAQDSGFTDTTDSIYNFITINRDIKPCDSQREANVENCLPVS